MKKSQNDTMPYITNVMIKMFTEKYKGSATHKKSLCKPISDEQYFKVKVANGRRWFLQNSHLNYLLRFLVKDPLWNVGDASYKERTQWLRKPWKFSRLLGR